MVLNFSYVANLWLMAGMYFQRYISVYYPMLKYHQKGIWRYLSDTRILIFIALIFGTIHMINSAPRNCSAPMTVFDETVYSCNNAQNHLKTVTDYCRYAICNFLSYISPVIIDIVLNISVVFYKPDDKKFSHVTAGSRLEKKKSSSAYKIEPKEQYKAAQKRRHRRIITCAIVVTIQLVLYIPILVCAFIIVAHLLCKDYDPKSKRSKEQTADFTLVSANNNNNS
uniref:G-protein coupled receptors family 1 profile domain-containing protein n=1 Tax=Panagrolaimus davidi TaxID=227884 RepID=A0A914QTB8_9BILA